MYIHYNFYKKAKGKEIPGKEVNNYYYCPSNSFSLQENKIGRFDIAGPRQYNI